MVSEDIRAMIPDYVRGLLSPAEAHEVETALAGFPELSSEFEAARAYYVALDQIPEVKAPPGFLDRVNRGIEREPFWPRVRKILFEPVYVKLPIELAGLAACIIITLAVNTSFMPRDNLTLSKPPSFAADNKSAAEAAVPAETMRRAEEKSSVPSGIAGADQARKQPVPENIPDKAAADKAAKSSIAPAKSEKDKNNLAPVALAQAEPLQRNELVTKEKKSDLQSEPATIVTAAKQATRQATFEQAATPAAEADRYLARSSIAETAPVATLHTTAAAPRAKLTDETEGESLAAAADTISEIGTIELSSAGAGNDNAASQAEVRASSGPALYATAIAILRAYDSRCIQTIKNGKVTFVCTIRPNRLSALIEKLGRPFNVTTHLFPYDNQQVRWITVSFVVQ